MIGTGSYAIYKDNEASNSEITKPVITEELNSDSTAVVLKVTHDKAIDRIEYYWTDDEVQTRHRAYGTHCGYAIRQPL